MYILCLPTSQYQARGSPSKLPESLVGGITGGLVVTLTNVPFWHILTALLVGNSLIATRKEQRTAAQGRIR